MAVRNDPMNQRGPKPGTNVARTKEPCPGCGQTKKASSTPAPVVTPEQFTQDQGAGLWARACTAVGAHLRMLETYARTGIPGCSIPQLNVLRDDLDQIIQSIEEQDHESEPPVEPDPSARARDGEDAEDDNHGSEPRKAEPTRSSRRRATTSISTSANTSGRTIVNGRIISDVNPTTWLSCTVAEQPRHPALAVPAYQDPSDELPTTR